MLDIDAGILAQLESSELQFFTLITMAIDGGNTWNFTDCDVPIAWNSTLFTPRGYKLGQMSFSLSKIVDSAQFSIDNLDDILTYDFVGGNPQGSAVTFRLVVLDTDYKIVGTYPDDNLLLFYGEIDDWSMPDEGKVEITVASDLVRWHQRTLRMQSSSCSWRAFKGTECGYSGAETTCNRSYARCVALGNSANFGGERWLPSIELANIWWGSTPVVGK